MTCSHIGGIVCDACPTWRSRQTPTPDQRAEQRQSFTYKRWAALETEVADAHEALDNIAHCAASLVERVREAVRRYHQAEAMHAAALAQIEIYKTEISTLRWDRDRLAASTGDKP